MTMAMTDKQVMEFNKLGSEEEKLAWLVRNGFRIQDEPIRTPNLAEEANAIIYGDREKTYGHPAKNLKTIASLWSTYLSISVTPEDVCNLMILMKTARLKNQPDHRDSNVDIIGYTLLKERVRREPGD